MAEVEMKTLVCPGPPEHEFQVPKGRGRPPRYCDVHNPKNQQGTKSNSRTEESSSTKESKVEEQAPRTRPRPGAPRKAPRIEPTGKTWADEPVSETRPAPAAKSGSNALPSVGTPDSKSRAKAEAAAERTRTQVEAVDSEGWPRGVDGRPMAKITMTASELVPTGQYANVSVGPAQIVAFVDLGRKVEKGSGYFVQEELDILASALNQMAEVVEADVIAVQRDLVLTAMNKQMQNGS